MPVLKQIRQLALCALFVAAMQSQQVLSQSGSSSSADTPTITAAPPLTDTPSPTPSLTPIATQVNKLPDSDRGRRFPTPFSHPPKFDVKPAATPTRPRPTHEDASRGGTSGRNPRSKGHRALRSVGDEAGDEDSSDSVSERR